MPRPASNSGRRARPQCDAGPRHGVDCGAAATGLAFVLALQALLAGSASEPAPALPWLLAIGLACSAAAIGWTLWRQRALEIALRDAHETEPAAAAAPQPSPQTGHALPEALLAGLPLPVIVLDAAGHEVGKVVQANPVAAQLLGRTPAQLEGLAWPELRKLLPDGAGDRAAQAFGEPAKSVDAAWDAQARRIEAGLPAAPALGAQPHAGARRRRPLPTITNPSATPCRTTCAHRSVSSRASRRS